MKSNHLNYFFSVFCSEKILLYGKDFKTRLNLELHEHAGYRKSKMYFDLKWRMKHEDS